MHILFALLDPKYSDPYAVLANIGTPEEIMERLWHWIKEDREHQQTIAPYEAWSYGYAIMTSDTVIILSSEGTLIEVTTPKHFIGSRHIDI